MGLTSISNMKIKMPQLAAVSDALSFLFGGILRSWGNGVFGIEKKDGTPAFLNAAGLISEKGDDIDILVSGSSGDIKLTVTSEGDIKIMKSTGIGGIYIENNGEDGVYIQSNSGGLGFIDSNGVGLEVSEEGATYLSSKINTLTLPEEDQPATYASQNGKPIEYAGDYRLEYGPRSIPDKAYVDSVAAPSPLGSIGVVFDNRLAILNGVDAAQSSVSTPTGIVVTGIRVHVLEAFDELPVSPLFVVVGEYSFYLTEFDLTEVGLQTAVADYKEPTTYEKKITTNFQAYHTATTGSVVVIADYYYAARVFGA
jgi:hypothetical protein